MRKLLFFLIYAFILAVSLQNMGGTAFAAAPTLLYSDLTWGPRTGWDNTTAKGAAVSIWGRNFGPAVSTSTVTVGGVSIPADCTALIAEWNVAGVARGDRRITFWIPPTASTGARTVSVTVDGVTSSTLPLDITAWDAIFYVATNGNDGNSGRTISAPFRLLRKLNPCTGGSEGDYTHPAGTCNPLGDGQYIGYVRGGTYTTSYLDTNGGSYDPGYLSIAPGIGSATARKAVVGYPGETPSFNTANNNFLMIYQDSPWDYGVSYFTIAKMQTSGGSGQFWQMFGNYSRAVGNKIANAAPPWTGNIMVMNSKNSSIIGNWFDNNGDTNYEHNIYVKTEPWAMGHTYNQSVLDTQIAYNEFSNAKIDAQGGVIFLSRASDQSSSYIHDNTYIYGNYFHDGNADWFYVGDSVTLGNHLYYYTNIFGPNTQTASGLTCYYGSYDQYFYNNTFYQNGAGSSGNLDAEYTAKPVTRNNILSSRTGQVAFDLSNRSSGTINSQYDLFYNNTVPISGGGLTISNARSGNPLFTNPASGDFSLQAGSAAIGQGVNLYATMSALPRGIYDFEGKLLPSSGSWDIGAVQYAAGTPPPPDSTAPAAVTTLAASNPTANSVLLTWTATGDDGTTGTAVSYDIRYSIAAITNANWAAATQVAAEPAPLSAGTSQSMTVTGLTASTPFYFAMKVSDEIPNVSLLSNVVTSTTLPSPDTSAPAAVSTLVASGPTSNSVTLTWTATGDDGTTGTAASYDIRYSTSAITNANWAAATQVAAEPAPLSAGTSQSITVTGLAASTPFYFAMKVSDEVPNVSFLSNVVTSTTLGGTGDTTPPSAPTGLRILP